MVLVAHDVDAGDARTQFVERACNQVWVARPVVDYYFELISVAIGKLLKQQ